MRLKLGRSRRGSRLRGGAPSATPRLLASGREAGHLVNAQREPKVTEVL